MPDENDIIFDQYGIDIIAIIKAMFGAVDGGEMTVTSVISLFETVWSIFVTLSFILAILFLIGYIYASLKFNRLAEIEAQGVKDQEHLYQQLYGATNTKQSRMADLEAHIKTDNPNDWKLAIIEADIELERILESAGYPGGTVGEKLKGARAASSMQTINDAWNAHMVRNKIAHAGTDFVLTKKIAQETINQYKRVFAEFGEV